MPGMTTLPSAPTFLLHWSGSEIAGITVDGDLLTLRFSAAFGHRAGGGPDGTDGPAGYLRPVEMVFDGASWRGDDPAVCLGGLAQGSLLVDGVPPSAGRWVLPLPLAQCGEVVCEFRLISGTALRIEAKSVVARSGDGARFQESFAC